MHDESGIAWDVETRDDGTRSLRVAAQPGRRYTIEQSADLEEWSPVRSWLGLTTGQVVSTDIFVGPPPPGAPTGQGQPVSPPADLPRTAMVMLQPVDDDSTVLVWQTGSSCVRIHEPLASGSWGPPTMIILHAMEFEGWTVLLQSSDLAWSAASPSLPPADPVLSQDDSDFHAALLSNRAAIASAVQAIHDKQQAALQEARLHGLAAGASAQGRYFRVREDGGIDSDGDGLTDEQELASGLNIFCGDTDGDGMDDRFEVANGLNGRDCGDAALDLDFDGSTNLQECLANSDPHNDDTDRDGVKDGEDAAPLDIAVDWKRRFEPSYAWVPLAGYNPATHGRPVSMNNRGQVLCEKAVWSAGAWTTLKTEGGTYAVIPPQGGEAEPAVLTGTRGFDIDDGGHVLGYGVLGSGTTEYGAYWLNPDDPPLIVGLGAGSLVTPGLGFRAPLGLSPDGWIASTGNGTVCAWRPPGGWAGPAGLAWPTDPAELGATFALGTFGNEPVRTGGAFSLFTFRWGAPAVSYVLFPPKGQDPPEVMSFTVPDERFWAAAIGKIPQPGDEQGPPTGQAIIIPGIRIFIGRLNAAGARVWRESTSLQGACATNSRGEAINSSSLWRNGKWTPLADLLPPALKTAGWQVTAGDINDEGAIVAGLRAATASNTTDFDQIGILLPVEMEITHVDSLAAGMSKTSVLRDEIVDLRVKIPPAGDRDWQVRLDVTPEALRTSNLAAPGSNTPRNNVLMFDFAQPHPTIAGLYTSTTAESDGTEGKSHSPAAPGNKNPFDITELPADKNGELTLRATFNKAGAIKVRVRSCGENGEYDGRIDASSSAISVVTTLPNGQPRLRQYAEGNDFTTHDANGYGLTNQHCNEYDQFFVETSTDWSDWGYGFTAEGNYTFAKVDSPGVPLVAALHDPELLKALAFKETQMSPDIAKQRKPGQPEGNPHDIMQLERGGSETEIMNNGRRRTFNASAEKVKIIGRKKIGDTNDYEASAEHDVYLYDGDGITGTDPAPATNYGYATMWYQNHVGPANSDSEQANIKWALRDLILKSHVTKAVIIKPPGGGDTLYGLDPQWLESTVHVLDSYGQPETDGYGNGVLKFQYEGRQESKFGWPRLATKTARR